MSSPSSTSGHEVFTRPLVFESQQDLHAWLIQASTSDQHQVDALSFTLTLPEDTNTDAERDEVLQSLQSLPSVRSLALYKLPADRYRTAHGHLYDELLRRVAKLWPRLESLAVHTDDHHLGFLRGLQALKKLQFTGFSASSPMETSAILSHLRHLTDIEIIPALGPPGPRNFSLQTVVPSSSSSSSQTRNPSLTREVLRSLRGLRSFTLREARATNPAAPAFFTPTFLLALASATSGVSLSRVTVELADFEPDIEAEQRFCQFLTGSHVRHVDVQWGDPNGNEGVGEAVVEALPRGVSTLRIRGLVNGEGLRKLAERRRGSGLKDLKEVVVVLGDRDRDTLMNEAVCSLVNEAVTSLRESGVGVYLV